MLVELGAAIVLRIDVHGFGVIEKVERKGSDPAPALQLEVERDRLPERREQREGGERASGEIRNVWPRRRYSACRMVGWR